MPRRVPVVNSLTRIPDSNWNEFHSGEEIVCSLIVAGGEAAVTFDFVEEALDKVSAPVKGGAQRREVLAVGVSLILAQTPRAARHWRGA